MPRLADVPRQWPDFPAYRIASWLPTVCTEDEDVPRLTGAVATSMKDWVRLNAAKTLAWIGDRRAASRIADLLAQSKPEAEFGYSGIFKDEEYNDPAPRWREGLIRALGLLGADEHTELIAMILNDERNVLEIRHAAAESLADLGTDQAEAFRDAAAVEHDFHSVRQRSAAMPFGSQDLEVPTLDLGPFTAHTNSRRNVREETTDQFDAIVFIKGDNNIPNTIGTVEQADRWRQTYVVTDSGPAYRPGRNLFVLRPPRPDGEVTALTRFQDGYVAEPEMSWDGRHVDILSSRCQEDPWWHVWRIGVDGYGTRTIDRRAIPHVGPAYLPDGRIVLASSRTWNS